MGEIWTLIFNPPHAVKPIVVLIWATTAAAWTLICRRMLATAAGLSSLERARKAANDAQGSAKTMFDAIRYAVEPPTEKPVQHPLRKLLDQSEALAQRGLLEEQSELLMQLQSQDEDAMAALPRYAASTCVLLGLLGTVVGMTVSTAELLPTLGGAKQPDQVVEHLKGTLLGLRTAFGATLVGILGTVLISFGNMLSQWMAQVLIVQRERFLLTVIHPLLVSAYSPEAALVEATDNLRRVAKQLGAVHSELTATAEQLDAASSRLYDVSEKSGVAVQRLRETAEMLEALSRSLEPILGGAMETIQRSDRSADRAEQLYHQLVTKMNELTQNIVYLVAQHSSSADGLRKAVEEMATGNARAQGVLGDLATDSHSLLRGLVSADDGLMTKLGEVQAAVGELLREMRQANQASARTPPATGDQFGGPQPKPESPPVQPNPRVPAGGPQPDDAQGKTGGSPPYRSSPRVWWNPTTWFERRQMRRRG